VTYDVWLLGWPRPTGDPVWQVAACRHQPGRQQGEFWQTEEKYTEAEARERLAALRERWPGDWRPLP
jgi:hypothetical protein